MATKAEIIASIHAGMARVQETFGDLSDEQLATPVHNEEAGWTAREILIHLAGRAIGYNLTVRLAEGGGIPSGGGFNVNDWNQRRIDERREKSRDELLAEFRTVHEALITRVEGMSDEFLARTIPRGPGVTITVAEAMRLGGGQHSISHNSEVEQALGLAR